MPKVTKPLEVKKVSQHVDHIHISTLSDSDNE